MIKEINIDDVQDVCFTHGSTHILKTCKIDNQKYFLKFSEPDLFDSHDPSLQILIEYLAYKIYSLYPNVKIPSNIHLVYNAKQKAVGLATNLVKGKIGDTISSKDLSLRMSSGVFVDIFLANWDVVGADRDNILIDKDNVTRIDPGGSLTFRAQGGRKGKAFNSKASELKTMLDPSTGSGLILSKSDVKVGAKEFLSVSWSSVSNTIVNVNKEIINSLKKYKMHSLQKQWDKEIKEVAAILASRHDVIKNHCIFVLKN